ncbi:MAG: DUF1501 domain-containing protein, partial [Planctomycetia bacterium]
SIPGYHVGELLPHTAKAIHLASVVRSMTHQHPIHGVAYATTGLSAIDVAMELAPQDNRHWPFFGSVVDYLDQRANPSVTPPLPRNIALPFPMSSRRRGEVFRAGPYAAFLGPAYNPVWTEFVGDGTKPIRKTLREETLDFLDPYAGVASDGRFTMSESGSLGSAMPADRLALRRNLLRDVDEVRRRFEGTDRTRSFDRFQDMAFSLLTSAKLRDALDLQREPAGVRDAYGLTLFGQASLAARRLVEAGSRLVTVFWDEFGLAGSGWDTHWDHYYRMKEELCPGFDRGFAGLLHDLDQRGLLDETLVVCMSEHGRTPKLNGAKGEGRDHWARAYSVVLAGAGLPRGRVIGRTDRIAGDVTETPVSPKDLLAT